MANLKILKSDFVDGSDVVALGGGNNPTDGFVIGRANLNTNAGKASMKWGQEKSDYAEGTK